MREITDVVSCPGTDSCKLGITSSMGLNQAVEERIEAMEITDPLTKRIHVKMSGCPNGCGQHHIASIGFYGASIKVGDHTIPAYIAHIGGSYEDGEVGFGARLKARLPAKRVPDAVERWVRLYEDQRNDGEEFNAFAERVGTDVLRGQRQGPLDADRVQPREPQPLHRLGPQGPLQGRAWRGRVRGIELDVAPITNGNGAANGHAPPESRVDPAAVTAELEGRSAEDVIAWAIETFHPKLYFASSFQKTSSVIIDIAQRIEPETRFFYLDTDVLFDETYATRDALAERYGIEFERYSGISLDEQERVYGGELWNRQPDACCGIRKVEPMREALSGLDCWVSGIRRVGLAHARRRREVRLGPALRALEAQPARRLDASATCGATSTSTTFRTTRCTTMATLRSDARTARARPGAGESPRAGRWATSEKTECGLNG